MWCPYFRGIFVFLLCHGWAGDLGLYTYRGVFFNLIGIRLLVTYLISCLTCLLNVLQAFQNLLCELSVG